MNGGILRGFVVEVTVIFCYRTLRRQEGGEALVRVVDWMADKIKLQGGLSRDAANRPRSGVELMLLRNVLISSISVEINLLLGNPYCSYLLLRI